MPSDLAVKRRSYQEGAELAEAGPKLPDPLGVLRRANRQESRRAKTAVEYIQFGLRPGEKATPTLTTKCALGCWCVHTSNQPRQPV